VAIHKHEVERGALPGGYPLAAIGDGLDREPKSSELMQREFLVYAVVLDDQDASLWDSRAGWPAWKTRRR
jgi:hypothetical protein